ncbi:hypothetical protein ACR6HW_04455 [Fusibacter sp. JL298sf-3]
MKKNLWLLFLLAFTLVGCKAEPVDVSAYDSEITSLKADIQTLTETLETTETALKKAEEDLAKALEEEPVEPTEPTEATDLISAGAAVMALIEAEDFDGLSAWIHPDEGLLLKPYPNSDPGTSQSFTASEIAAAYASPDVLNWGTFDGSGEPIDYTFEAYYDRFIYDVDFIEPETIAVNHTISVGNAITDLEGNYPGASYLEYHFSGFEPEYEGIDWKSLFLVFKKVGDNWYLIAIEHSQWTI